MAGVVQVIVLAKREPTVDHNITFRVQRIRVNQHRDVTIPWIIRLRRVHALRVPPDWQLVRYPRQQFVARRITPQHEVVRGDILVGDFHVTFYARLAAELPAPVVNRMIHFCRRPLPDFFADCCPCRRHHEERIHESVVDRTLQTVMLLQHT